MLLRFATLGALGYAGYKFYAKNRGGLGASHAPDARPLYAGDPGPLREGADTDGAGSPGMVSL
jgi:hypothetical protein